MLILSIESSAKPASVAICSDDKLLGQYYQNSALTHSRTLMAMTESLLKNLDINIIDIDLFAVSRGPGSFTGVRIGVSAAKGIAWGAGKPICGVSTLEAIACQIPAHDITICPVMDARRDQVYNALFKWDNGTLIRKIEDRAISLVKLSKELRDTENNYLLAGDGALMTYEYLTDNNVPCRMAPELLRNQTAYGVTLAALHTEPIESIALEPSYLRPSQAERMRTPPVAE